MSRAPSTRELVVAITLAAVVLAVGVGVVVRPDRLDMLPSLEARVAVLGSMFLLVVAAVAVGIAGKLRASTVEPLVSSTDGDPVGSRDTARSSWRSNSSSDADGRRLRTGVTSSERPIVGQPYDQYVELATAYGEETREVRDDAREKLLESMRPVAARTYVDAVGCSREEAIRAIETGRWTDDGRAAAFLATEDGPSTPLWLWILDLFRTADPFSRGLERTIAELEQLHAQRTGSSVPPEGEP